MKQSNLTLIKLATPIILAMLSQSLLNLVDAALVGPLGEEALAAVGAGSYANFVALALIAGFISGRAGSGCQTCGCRKAQPVRGASEPWHYDCLILCPARECSATHSGAMDIVAVSAKQPGSGKPPKTYFRIRVMALMAAAMSLSFRGYWNGTGQPSGFLRILVISHVFNAFVSYVLIYGKCGVPPMGVARCRIGNVSCHVPRCSTQPDHSVSTGGLITGFCDRFVGNTGWN